MYILLIIYEDTVCVCQFNIDDEVSTYNSTKVISILCTELNCISIRVVCDVRCQGASCD